MTARTFFAALALVALGGAAFYGWPTEPTISGHARIVDGDTLVVAGERIRLFGIDAPELHQTCGGELCGRAAKAALERMTRDAAVTCVERDRDKYGRAVAVCRVPGVVADLGARLVALGLAVSYTKFSTDYLDHERAAKAEKLGIWRTGFIPPEQFRHGAR